MVVQETSSCTGAVLTIGGGGGGSGGGGQGEASTRV